MQGKKTLLICFLVKNKVSTLEYFGSLLFKKFYFYQFVLLNIKNSVIGNKMSLTDEDGFIFGEKG